MISSRKSGSWYVPLHRVLKECADTHRRGKVKEIKPPFNWTTPEAEAEGRITLKLPRTSDTRDGKVNRRFEKASSPLAKYKTIVKAVTIQQNGTYIDAHLAMADERPPEAVPEAALEQLLLRLPGLKTCRSLK